MIGEAEAGAIGRVIAKRILAATAPLHQRIADLEIRLAAVEVKGVEYGGTWQRAVEYKRGKDVNTMRDNREAAE